MGSVVNLGKYLFGIPFLVFGIFHFMNAESMSGMAFGSTILVYLVGICLIAAAISIWIGKLDKLACVLLALLMLIFVFAVHLPGVMNAADEAARMGPMSGLLKDIGLAGGALLCAKNAKDKAVIG